MSFWAIQSLNDALVRDTAVPGGVGPLADLRADADHQSRARLVLYARGVWCAAALGHRPKSGAGDRPGGPVDRAGRRCHAQRWLLQPCERQRDPGQMLVTFGFLLILGDLALMVVARRTGHPARPAPVGRDGRAPGRDHVLDFSALPDRVRGCAGRRAGSIADPHQDRGDGSRRRRRCRDVELLGQRTCACSSSACSPLARG